MTKKIYLYILRGGCFLALLSVLMFSADLFFPYITSKQIYFNILLEILGVFWLGLIIRYPEYRPFDKIALKSKMDYLTTSLLVFFFALIVSAIFGVDFNLSFWGDFERMLGIFHILHFLLFYFILITVFKDWKNWKYLFTASILVAFVVAFKGLGGKDYSTLGNTAYLAVYMIFNIYFCLLLFFKEKSGLKFFYLLPLPFLLLAFKKANISGATVGLGISLISFLGVYAFFHKNKKIKKYFLFSFLLICFFIILIFLNKDKKPLSNIGQLQEISWQKNTFQTRLISWKTALKDFKNHPLIGTGYGNFAISFDKFFDPTFYNHTSSETYFDRAHNNVVEIISTAGIFGLASYLAIFVFVFVYLFKAFREKVIDINVFAVLSSLIIAYFIQNLALFDALASYIPLMMTLGFIYLLNQERKGFLEETADKGKIVLNSLRNKENRKKREIYTLVFAGFFSFFIIFNFNIKPLRVLAGTIDGQKAFISGDVGKAFSIYKKTLSQNTVLERDSRSSFLKSLMQNQTILYGLPNEERQEVLDFAVDLAKKNKKYNPNDNINSMYLANILNLASLFNKENKNKFYFYSDQALEAIEDSIKASPKRIPVYFAKSRILLNRGEEEKAVETLKYALSLNKDFNVSYCRLGELLLKIGREDEGYKNIGECLDRKGSGNLDVLFLKKLANYYQDFEDKEKLLEIYKNLSIKESKNPQNFINLAIIYKDLGNKEKAIESAQKALMIDKSLKSATNDFIEGLE